MAVSDLIYRLTGGGGNADPNASLGGATSSVAVSGTPMNNLFDDVDAGEAAGGDSEYRAISIVNTGGTPVTNVSMYLSVETPSASTDLQFWLEGVDPVAPLSVVNESTAPAGSTFQKYTSGAKLSIGTINAGSYARVWIKRIVNAACPSSSNDQGTITVEGA